MILDLIVILFVIVLSFCLCINEKINNNITNCQISHILVGLSVIVFYKLVKYFKIKDKSYNINKSIESFNNSSISQDINNFISGINSSIPSTDKISTLTSEQIVAYSTQLNNLTNQISQLQTTLTSPTTATISSDTSNIPSLNIEAQQQYQQFQIDYLNKQIKNSQDILNAQAVTNSSTNYKPIKVFSSCVIANADGTTTIDKPVNPTIQNKAATKSSDTSSVSSFADTLANNIINNTISQSNFSNELNLSPETGIFRQLASTYLNQ